jgi:hypothetical protein
MTHRRRLGHQRFVRDARFIAAHRQGQHAVLRYLARAIRLRDCGCGGANNDGPPPEWICRLLGIGSDAFNHGGTPEFAAISAVAVRQPNSLQGHSGRRRRNASVLDADTLQCPIVAGGRPARPEATWPGHRTGTRNR